MPSDAVNDVFVQEMEMRISNLNNVGSYEKSEYFEGQKSGFEYALAIYRDIVKHGTVAEDRTMIKTIADALDGIEYGEEMDPIVLKNAKIFGAVIVFGASDGLVEFRGAIDDESGCYGTGTICFNRSGELRSECSEDDCPYFEAIRQKASKIKAIWDSEGYSWTYETDIPHETFEILERGIKYCRGVVFNIDDVKEDVKS